MRRPALPLVILLVFFLPYIYAVMFTLRRLPARQIEPRELPRLFLPPDTFRALGSIHSDVKRVAGYGERVERAARRAGREMREARGAQNTLMYVIRVCDFFTAILLCNKN